MSGDHHDDIDPPPIMSGDTPTGDRKLLDLLARVHGDGGHHTGAVGLEQSALDAHRVVASLRMVVSADRGGIPCHSPGGSDCPPEGWHFIFGGPCTSYTMPEPDEDGDLCWWVFDEDEGAWTESQALGARIINDEELGDLTERAETAERERDVLRELVRAAQHHIPRSWPQWPAWAKRAFDTLGSEFALSGGSDFEDSTTDDRPDPDDMHGAGDDFGGSDF